MYLWVDDSLPPKYRIVSLLPGIVSLVNSGKLADHLKGIERMAEQRMDTLLPQLMKAAGVTEELKARDQMAWVGLVNNCRARADEIILADLVYV